MENHAPIIRFLLGLFGGGIVGLRKAIRKAFGKEPEGVPLVLTRDQDGKPTSVKYIPEERKRRLNVFHDFEHPLLTDPDSKVNGLTLEYTKNPENIKLKFLLDENVYKLRRKLPKRVKGIPVVFQEETVGQLSPLADRSTDYYSSISANINCGIYEGSSDGSYNFARGTITAVGSDAGTGLPAILGAGHMVIYRDDQYLYQPYNALAENITDPSIGKLISYEGISSSEMDYAIFKVETSTRTMNPRGTEVSIQPDITDTWSFNAISDAVDPVAETGPKAAFGGCLNTATGCEAVRTVKNGNLRYEVRYKYDYNLEKGDSGGPFVDSSGRLMSQLSARYYDEFIGGGRDVVIGGAGMELLNAAGFSLY